MQPSVCVVARTPCLCDRTRKIPPRGVKAPSDLAHPHTQGGTGQPCGADRGVSSCRLVLCVGVQESALEVLRGCRRPRRGAFHPRCSCAAGLATRLRHVTRCCAVAQQAAGGGEGGSRQKQRQSSRRLLAWRQLPPRHTRGVLVTGCTWGSTARPHSHTHARWLPRTSKHSGAAAARFRGRPAGVGLGSRLKVGGRLWGSCLAPAQHPRTRAQLRAAARKGV